MCYNVYLDNILLCCTKSFYSSTLICSFLEILIFFFILKFLPRDMFFIDLERQERKEGAGKWGEKEKNISVREKL